MKKITVLCFLISGSVFAADQQQSPNQEQLAEIDKHLVTINNSPLAPEGSIEERLNELNRQFDEIEKSLALYALQSSWVDLQRAVARDNGYREEPEAPTHRKLMQRRHARERSDITMGKPAPGVGSDTGLASIHIPAISAALMTVGAATTGRDTGLAGS